jgi:hypothetical protein
MVPVLQRILCIFVFPSISKPVFLDSLFIFCKIFLKEKILRLKDVSENRGYGFILKEVSRYDF